MTIDPTFPVAIPAPAGQGIVVGPVTAATVVGLFAPVITVTSFVPVGIGLGGQLGTIAGRIELI